MFFIPEHCRIITLQCIPYDVLNIHVPVCKCFRMKNKLSMISIQEKYDIKIFIYLVISKLGYFYCLYYNFSGFLFNIDKFTRQGLQLALLKLDHLVS